MNYSNQLIIINSLKELALIGNQNKNETENNESQISYGFGEMSIRFVGEENIKKFKNGVNKLLSVSSLNNDIDIKGFENKIYDLIYHIRAEERECVEDDIIEIYDYYLKMKRIDFEIITPIYGVTIDEDYYKLGQFTIYKKSYVQSSKVKGKSSYQEPFKIVDSVDSEYMIGISIAAREQSKATDVAYTYLESFENVLRYLVGDIRQIKCPGIFNYKGRRDIKSLAITKEGLGMSNRTLSLSMPVTLDDNLCKSKHTGGGIIWDLITNPQKSEMKQRILRSIEWTGKAIYEADKAKSIVQYVFAIEGLLQLNKKDFITSSIVSQISDWLAFIIADELESRKKIVKYFNEAYQKRSAVAHGGAVDITEKDIFNVFYLCKMAINLLLSHDDFININTTDELREYVNNQKFK